jgi:nucleotide-binding universal stress UspA family protein
MSMDMRLLLSIEMDLSPVTRYTLRSVGEFFAQTSPRLGIFLLTVIPDSYTASPSLVSFRGSLRPLSPTFEQRRAAERALCSARKMLEHYGIAAACIQVLIREGIPADELVAVAQEFSVDWIAIGWDGNSPWQRLRRLFLGSTSRRVLERAPCPVVLVALPRPRRRGELITWYEKAMVHSLHECPGALTVLTPREAARQYAPPEMDNVGRKEINAAAHALERLACSVLPLLVVDNSIFSSHRLTIPLDLVYPSFY